MDYRQSIQIQALLGQASWPVFGFIAGIVTITFVFKDSVPSEYLYPWLLLGLLILFIELAIAMSSLRIKSPLEHPFWKWSVHIGCVVTGVYYASSLAFLPLAESPTQVVVLVVIYALVLASIFTGSAYYLKAYYLIFPPLLLPVFYLVFHYGGDYKYLYLLTLALFILGMHFFIVGFNKVFNDLIISQEKAENLLLEVSDERDRANKAMLEKNNFLALASHDLRQPVHAIGLFVAALDRHVDDNRGKEILNQINTSTNTMGSLFNSILDLSKLDANAVENFPVPVNLCSFLDRIRPELSELALHKGLDLEVFCESQVYIHIDPLILHRIVANLATNAIKFSERGSIRLIVTCNDGTVELSVEDDGVGIATADLSTIFSEFHQLKNPNRDRQSGLGLGLSIVKRLCNLAGIEITVESEKGRGSTFLLSMPQLTEIGHTDVELIERPDEYQDLTVVVIDDEPEILIAMTTLLGQWGCHVVAASGVEEASSYLTGNGRPDIVIADYRLNNQVTGIDLIRKFRERFGEKLPSILITGDTAPAYLQEFSESKVTVLYKPVLPDKLQSAINEAMSQ